MSFRPSTLEEHSFDRSGVDLEAMEGPSGTSSQIAPLQNQPTSSSGPSDSTNKTEGLWSICYTLFMVLV